jgi:bifunctional non-homologous end joining protein LigD
VKKQSLQEYQRKRHRDRTPEPIPPAEGDRPSEPSPGNSFVIQEHHASSLHWDFRLEHDGVLASWALPKGIPISPTENHLAVQVEDHPLAYGSFSGVIPSGQYGGGEVSVWDHGTYQCEKWSPREIKVVLHGKRVEGRFVLFPTQGKNWMIHRMDPPPPGFEPLPRQLAPMLATAGVLPPDGDAWAFEFKWDGIRVLLWVDGGRPRALSRAGREITTSFPELREVAAAVGSDQVVLDGEIVVLDESGRPSFSRLQHRLNLASANDVKQAALRHPISLVVFDLLHLNGRSVLALPYDQRRVLLEQLELSGPQWGITPSFTDTPGSDVLRSAVGLGMEGVVAKRRASIYRPGVRSRDWIKVKSQRTQEVVIGGWTAGKGERHATFGALLLGVPAEGGGRRLDYVGKVGTGFSERTRRDLLATLGRLVRKTSPFVGALPAPVESTATWVRPATVGEVTFTEWTTDGLFRHPVWRGIRPDKSAGEVRRES